MLRYKTETKPGLVALYDIRPGNRAGQFWQPQSPHGAITINHYLYRYYFRLLFNRFYQTLLCMRLGAP